MASDEEKQERKEGEEENLGEEKMKTARLEEEEADATAAYEAIEAETEASLVELSRSERKRHREKKRRSDVNRGLDQLMDLVFLIDPELKLEAEDRAQKASGGRTTSSDPPLLSRVELINSAVATLERVHRENEERKMVIAHLARGLLAGGNGNGSGGEDAAAAAAAPLPPNSMQSAFPTPRDIQRQEIQKQMNLDALVAASKGGSNLQQSLRASPTSLVPEAAALGLGSASRRGPASLVRPPLPAPDLALGARNQAAAAALLGASSGLPDGSSLLGDPGRDGLGGNQALYRALLSRKLEEEQALAAAGLGAGAAAGLGGAAAAGLHGASGLLGRMNNPSLLGSQAPTMSGDSLRQALMREQTIAQAAAARTQGELNLDGSASKRAKRSFP